MPDVAAERTTQWSSRRSGMTSIMLGTLAVMYEGRSETVNRGKDLKESVAMHREIYRLIRADKAGRRLPSGDERATWPPF